eukprot:6856622-Pyramimonas_sp.AAC.1
MWPSSPQPPSVVPLGMWEVEERGEAGGVCAVEEPKETFGDTDPRRRKLTAGFPVGFSPYPCTTQRRSCCTSATASRTSRRSSASAVALTTSFS